LLDPKSLLPESEPPESVLPPGLLDPKSLLPESEPLESVLPPGLLDPKSLLPESKSLLPESESLLPESPLPLLLPELPLFPESLLPLPLEPLLDVTSVLSPAAAKGCEAALSPNTTSPSASVRSITSHFEVPCLVAA